MTDTLPDADPLPPADPLHTAVATVIAATADMVAINQRAIVKRKQATGAMYALVAERDEAVAQRDHFAERLAESRARNAELEGRPATDSGRAEAHARAAWDGWSGARRHGWRDEPSTWSRW